MDEFLDYVGGLICETAENIGFYSFIIEYCSNNVSLAWKVFAAIGLMYLIKDFSANKK